MWRGCARQCPLSQPAQKERGVFNQSYELLLSFIAWISSTQLALSVTRQTYPNEWHKFLARVLVRAMG